MYTIDKNSTRMESMDIQDIIMMMYRAMRMEGYGVWQIRARVSRANAACDGGRGERHVRGRANANGDDYRFIGRRAKAEGGGSR